VQHLLRLLHSCCCLLLLLLLLLLEVQLIKLRDAPKKHA
jgi:hypothetical protein